MIVQLSSGVASLAGLPDRPQARHEQRLAVVAVHEERRLGGLLAGSRVGIGPPFVLAVHRHQAALALGAEPRKAGELATLSARALISSGPLLSGAPSGPALTHGGISPQRISRTRRVGSSSGSLCRVTTVAIVAGGRHVVVGRRRRWRGTGGLVDRLDFLGQQGRIRRDRKTSTHDFHGGRYPRHPPTRQDEAVSHRAWTAPHAPAPVHATVTVPGSKSQTNRALVLAGLAAAQGQAAPRPSAERCAAAIPT